MFYLFDSQKFYGKFQTIPPLVELYINGWYRRGDSGDQPNLLK